MLPKSKFCFYCSCVRARNYEKQTYFLDILVDERDFQEKFCKMISNCIDLDTHGQLLLIIQIIQNIMMNVIIMRNFIIQEI